MEGNLSTNTKAILLLTAPLINGRNNQQSSPLTHSQYNRFAAYLHEMGCEPADLLSPRNASLIEQCEKVVEPTRLQQLLSRGFLLSQAVERWQSRAIWVASRADPEYPQRLKCRLKADAPPVIYGCGQRSILDSGGIAVVGSRQVDDQLIEYTEEIGRLAAASRRTLISGGARGIDQAAMRAAIEGGGVVVGVLADRLEKQAMNRDHRDLLLEERLVLISPYDPSAGFNVGNAMQRNKLIYALSDAALVVNADFNKGGTWAGAREQLKKFSFVPVYVRTTGPPSQGLCALRELGALPWPEPSNPGEFESALSSPITAQAQVPQQSQLQFGDTPSDIPSNASNQDSPASATTTSSQSTDMTEGGSDDPARQLFNAVRDVMVAILVEPKSAAQVAEALDVTKRQAEEWLKRFVDEGVVEKTTRPVRYVRRSAGLFDGDNEGEPCPTSIAKPISTS